MKANHHRGDQDTRHHHDFRDPWHGQIYRVRGLRALKALGYGGDSVAGVDHSGGHRGAAGFRRGKKRAIHQIVRRSFKQGRGAHAADVRDALADLS